MNRPFVATLLIVIAGLLEFSVCFAAEGAPKPREFPSLDSAQRIRGELVSADFIHRTGQFRANETGKLMDFTMPPYASISYLNAEADLRDVPLGTNLDFFLHKDSQGGDAQGSFTRLAKMQEQSTQDAGDEATEQQRAKHAAFVKMRGLPGWVDRTEGNKLTVTLFSGEPKKFNQAWLTDFNVGKEVAVVVANDELRTWNPNTDKEKGTLVAIHDVPTDGYGCSGVQLVFTVPNMLEGFRRGRVVRVFGTGWPLKDQFYGESLMGYGYARLQNTELVESTPKEYPAQFPFRTDHGNAHLPWYKLQTDVAPPSFSEHLVFGELVKTDAAQRAGEFRTDRTGKLVPFTLIPTGIVRYLNAAADLADLPVGSRCRFHMYQDEQGAFTRASLVTDEFSYLSANAVTYRIEALKLSEGKLHVARQMPPVKNYNGDMEQPPDIARTELLVTADTRLRKGDQPAQLADLAVGDVLLVNLTGELPGSPSRCTDIWIGPETHKLATELQAKKHEQQAKKHPPTKK